MRHFPSERDGCWYERAESCCWLCRLRLAWSTTSATRIAVRSSEESADGQEATVSVGASGREVR